MRASRVFRALGDPSRLRLLTLLAEGESCVTAVAESEGEDLSTISQRLRVLWNEGIVSRRRQGKQMVYALADPYVADLIFNALEHASGPKPAHYILEGREPVTTHVTYDPHR